MKNDSGRYVLIGVLIICFVSLLLFSQRIPEEQTVFMNQERSLQNGSLSIYKDEDGVFFVNGKGKISGRDFNSLMQNLNVTKQDVYHIIFGNQITEIGYGVLNGYLNIETIRIGDQVKTIEDGAVKNCLALKYIYIPITLNEVGFDFLSNSINSPVIVTDGDLATLPTINHTRNIIAYTGVDSYESMSKLIGKEDLLPFLMKWWNDERSITKEKTSLEPRKQVFQTNYYETGKILDFLDPSVNVRQYVISGLWDEADAGGTWTVSKELNIAFNMDSYADKIHGKLKYQTFNGVQSISIDVNGVQVYKGEGQGGELKFEFLNPGKYESISIIIRIPGAISPKALGMSTDSRELGLLLQEMVFTE